MPASRVEGLVVLLGGAHVHLRDHLRHLQNHGWRVGWVHDRNSERRTSLSSELGACPLHSLDGLHATPADAAIVCSETTFHEEDIMAALRAGLPVFSEKPLAGSAEAAQRIADYCDQHAALLQTGYFFRTIPELQKVSRWIADDRLGTVTSARMQFSHDGGYADWLNLDCWMTNPNLACYGGFVDEAVHAVDTLQWLLGPIASGFAVTGNSLGWSVDDHGAAIVRFESGVTGVIEAGWTAPKMIFELEVIGDLASVSLKEGELVLRERGGSQPVEHFRLAALDAGTGIDPFLAQLTGSLSSGLVPPKDAASVNSFLDTLELNLC